MASSVVSAAPLWAGPSLNRYLPFGACSPPSARPFQRAVLSTNGSRSFSTQLRITFPLLRRTTWMRTSVASPRNMYSISASCWE